MELQTNFSINILRGQAGCLYRMLWRWHFYAGLFCIPLIILLSITGSLYLFKPQIEAALDRPYTNLALTGPSAPVSQQVHIALKHVEGSSFKSYRLPDGPKDAAQVLVTKGGEDRIVFVHPTSLEILKALPREARLMAVVRSIHGELLMGDYGSLIVELAASWAIVMVVTGLYLWWPRTAQGLQGVLIPRLKSGPKVFWRDLHAVTGMWISFFALFLLLTGLPWTNVWGKGFDMVRDLTGTTAVAKDWTQSRTAEREATAQAFSHHGHDAPYYVANVDDIAASARAARLAPPVTITPPNAKNPNWMARSSAGDRISRVEIAYSAADGSEISREAFGDKHVIDQAMGVGIAAHEGQLFGVLNQVLGVLTALGLILLSVSAFVMWRKRAPDGVLGAPPPIPDQRIGVGLGLLIFVFALFLPVLGVCLILVAVTERLILSRVPSLRHFLGLAQPAPL
jgi:uncharacterized iron-regulated membrane protein